MTPAKEILIVDDEVGIRELLSEILQDEGYRVSLAENATAARAGHYAMAASSEPAPLPGGALLEGGRHELTTSVTVTWLLEDA